MTDQTQNQTKITMGDGLNVEIIEKLLNAIEPNPWENQKYNVWENENKKGRFYIRIGDMIDMATVKEGKVIADIKKEKLVGILQNLAKSLGLEFQEYEE